MQKVNDNNNCLSQIIVKRLTAIMLLFMVAVNIFIYYTSLVNYPRNAVYDYYINIENNTIDVLCVGSSHTYCSINPAQMYKEQGIAAYDFAAGAQSVWASYYFIKEALKRQKPKVIILDIYTVVLKDNFFDERAIKSNFLNMRPSFNKWEALKSANVNDKWGIYLQFPLTHSNYKSLGRENFNLEYNANENFLGYYYSDVIEPYYPEQITDVRRIKEIDCISKKAEKYLRMCIELCLKENIDIIVANAPWPDITEAAQKKYNRVQEITNEYEVPFLNGCLYTEEIGLDYTKDSMGNEGHLNFTGAEKYTRWLSSFLLKNYTLDDRRGDKRYLVWEQEADKLDAEIRKNELMKTEDIHVILDYLKSGKGLYYAISMNGKFLGGGA